LLDGTTQIDKTAIHDRPNRLLLGRRIYGLQHTQRCDTGWELMPLSIIQGDNNRSCSVLTHHAYPFSIKEGHHDGMMPSSV
jgi:hypothetical protein